MNGGPELQDRDFKGSRLRCLLATHRARAKVARFLGDTSGPVAELDESDCWLPRGFLHPEEATLTETEGLLEEEHRKELRTWWLAEPDGAKTPSWDIASTCRIDGRPGLLLVEAKAHVSELQRDQGDCCKAKNPKNIQRIEQALAEAQAGWNKLVPGFCLSATRHYQMSNRFAFAWKLASMQVPVILAYLGFLNAEEMKGKNLLCCHCRWEQCVVEHSDGIVPSEVWGRKFSVSNTPLIVLIRSANVQIDAGVSVECHEIK